MGEPLNLFLYLFSQLTEEAEKNVNKSRAFLNDIVRENKGTFMT